MCFCSSLIEEARKIEGFLSSLIEKIETKNYSSIRGLEPPKTSSHYQELCELKNQAAGFVARQQSTEIENCQGYLRKEIYKLRKLISAMENA